MDGLNQKQDDRITALEKGQDEILQLLRPISETYRTANILGKWTMGILVLASVVVGLIVGIKNI